MTHSTGMPTVKPSTMKRPLERVNVVPEAEIVVVPVSAGDVGSPLNGVISAS